MLMEELQENVVPVSAAVEGFILGVEVVVEIAVLAAIC
jgi:hypothetical protein